MPELSFDEMKAATREAMSDPRPGDLFHEMYSYWVYVVYVAPNGGAVVTMAATPPCTFPEDGTLQPFDSPGEFRAHFKCDADYGPWVLLHSRGSNVDGWVLYDESEAACLTSR